LLGLSVEITDVDRAGLSRRYGDRVPVVLDPHGAPIVAGRFGFLRLARGLLGVRLRP
jgi:hypothetical protein